MDNPLIRDFIRATETLNDNMPRIIAHVAFMASEVADPNPEAELAPEFAGKLAYDVNIMAEWLEARQNLGSLRKLLEGAS